MVIKPLKKNSPFFIWVIFFCVIENRALLALLRSAPLETINITGNACRAANCFTTISALPGSDPATINNALLALDFDCIQLAFEQMSPALFSIPTNAQLLDAVSIRSTYSKHLQNFDFNKNHHYKYSMSLWNDGFVEWQEQGNSFGYSDTTLGATIGIDYRIRRGILGSALSYTHDVLKAKNSNSKAWLSSYYGGLYSRWNFNKFYMNAALMGAFNCYKTRRQLRFGTINRNALAQHNGSQWLVHAGLEYQLGTTRFQSSPYINIDYVFQREHGYTESGANSLNLYVYPKNTKILVTEAGLSFSANYHACRGTFTPMFTIACVSQIPCSNENYFANFINSFCKFNGNGGSYKQTLFAPSLALIYEGLSKKINISIYLDNQVGSNYWAQDIAFDLTCRF